MRILWSAPAFAAALAIILNVRPILHHFRACGKKPFVPGGIARLLANAAALM